MREARRDLQRSEGRVHQLQDAIEQMNERCAAFNRFWDTVSRQIDVRAEAMDR